MSNELTIIFVPGAWHRAETWSKLIGLVEVQHHQYRCVAVSLPSTKSNPNVTLKDDIDVTRDAILAETEQGRDVVVVIHSYGGIPGQSAIKGLTRSNPDNTSTAPSTSKSGHVIGLVIIASGFVVPAKSFLDAMGGQPPPTWKLNYETGFAEYIADAREMFYHDLPEREGREWVGKLTDHSLKTLTEGGEHTYASWKDVPVWYIATTCDKSLPIEAQRFFVQTARDAGADVTLREVESSHSPMLSRPQETADIVVEAVEAFVG